MKKAAVSSIEWSREKHEEKNHRPDSLRYAACALRVCRGAAAEESPSDRVSIVRPIQLRESTRSEAIRLALRELGYIEGQNIAIEYRYAEGKRDRLPELAAELVRLKVDIIVVAGGDRLDPGGQECDQDDSHRYGGRWGRSCRGRPS